MALHNFFKALFLLHALEATWRENVKCVGFAPVGRVHVDMHLTTTLPIPLTIPTMGNGDKARSLI